MRQPTPLTRPTTIVVGKERPSAGVPPSRTARPQPTPWTDRETSQLHAVLDWAEDGSLIKVVAYRDRFSVSDEHLAYGIIDRLMGVEPLHLGAGLAVVQEDAPKKRNSFHSFYPLS